jgi:hypothetical protein
MTCPGTGGVGWASALVGVPLPQNCELFELLHEVQDHSVTLTEPPTFDVKV